ncbi:mannose-6-phosphate receptor binding domain-containing protein [Hygrophoropsis aurantiaca]|uniref:Mannose-6-phosphate receptor binding domain-containing protein n=1 Tax=Hygrophoropsis aurantiaca TaxID=72124 RepID=A0ACB8AP67_9AGAM|nr:mannose-6-phosphate receptor binding domain-containing protein [Hygrophoropsis aurantiaca]
MAIPTFLVLILLVSLPANAIYSPIHKRDDTEKPCTLHHEDNYYDLNPLKASKDYQFQTDSGHDFFLNVCKPVVSDNWNLREGTAGDVAGFVRKDHGDFSIGQVNTTLTMHSNALTLSLTNGSPCSASSFARTANSPSANPRVTRAADAPMYGSSFIRFICDTRVYGAGTPELIAQFPREDDSACGFDIEWRTHFACPKGERGIIGGILVFLVIATLLLLTTYTLLSTLYNRFVLRLRGPDSLPSYTPAHAREMAGVLVDLVKDACEHIGLGSGADVNPASHHWSAGAGEDDEGDDEVDREVEAMMGGAGGYVNEREDEGDVWRGGDRPSPNSNSNSSPHPEGVSGEGTVRL